MPWSQSKQSWCLPAFSTFAVGTNENGANWIQIYYATICQSKEIVKFLSSLTKSPSNVADINEWTPIHAASAFGFLDIVELLVPLVTDGVLRAAIETARNWGHNEIVWILETYSQGPGNDFYPGGMNKKIFFKNFTT